MHIIFKWDRHIFMDDNFFQNICLPSFRSHLIWSESTVCLSTKYFEEQMHKDRPIGHKWLTLVK